MGKISAARDLDLRNQTRWYLLANRAEAVIYRQQPGHAFQFVERILNPEGKMTEAELGQGRPGRNAASSRGSEIRHSLGSERIGRERAARDFARRLGEHLAVAQREDRLGELVLAAEPQFLGILRKSVPAPVRRIITHEIGREFRQGSDAEIHEQLVDSIKRGKS